MIRRLAIAFTFLLALLMADTVQAATCSGDYWGAMSSTGTSSAPLQITISGVTTLYHSTNHPTCAGDISVTVDLWGGASCPAPKTETHNWFGGTTSAYATRNCGNLQYDVTYTVHGVHEGFGMHDTSVDEDDAWRWTNHQGCDEACCAADPNGYWDGNSCIPFTPLIVAFGGKSSLTSAAGGVLFDLDGSGSKVQMSWTQRNSDSAWVVLDRNGNGQIDDATELFSSTSPQRPGRHGRNGFEALRMLDANVDGWIDAEDGAHYRSIQLWTDSNHDGISQFRELESLRASGIERMSLDYRATRRVDRAGNRWAYRARIIGDRAPSLWDVILQMDKTMATAKK